MPQHSVHGGQTASPASSPARAHARPLTGTSLWPIDPTNTGVDALFARVNQVNDHPETNLSTQVVFLHGLVGLNDHWEGVVQASRHRLRCTLFELPLLRFSGSHCSIEGVTDLTVRFLREHVLGTGGVNGPVILVGNSFGGHVALRIAIDHPELVKGLVLSGSGGLVEKTLVSDIQLRPTRPWLRKKIAELFFDESKMREADVDRALGELTARGGARAMVRLARSARKDELRDSIGRVVAPTLLLWGKQDVVTPPEAANGFKRLIPHSELIWFDRCGHAPMIEVPDQFAEKLLTFVEQVQAGRHGVAGGNGSASGTA